MHNLYGKRKLTAMEVKGHFTLSNGMYCVWGNPTDEGVSVDIYEDKTKSLLIGLEHGIQTGGAKPDPMMLKMLMESFIDDLEDSMVYYFGPKESQFDLEELKKQYPTVPKKTGKFA